MDSAIHRKYKQLTLFHCAEVGKKESEELSSPKVLKNTGVSDRIPSQSSEEDPPTLLGCSEGSGSSDGTSKQSKQHHESLWCEKVSLHEGNHQDLLEMIDSDHHRANEAIGQEADSAKPGLVTRTTVEVSSTITNDCEPHGGSERRQPIAALSENPLTGKPNGDDEKKEDSPVVIDLTKSPDSPVVEMRRITGIKRKRKKLYFSPRKKVRSSPEKSHELDSEITANGRKKLVFTSTQRTRRSLLGSGTKRLSSATEIDNLSGSSPSQEVPNLTASSREDTQASPPQSRTSTLSPDSQKKPRRGIDSPDYQTEPPRRGIENEEGGENENGGYEDETDDAGEESEYPMPSTAQQKEQRRLYRLKQLKEMRARETMEARQERALKRRGEPSPSKKQSSSTRKRVSWREGSSLVSIFSYDYL